MSQWLVIYITTSIAGLILCWRMILLLKNLIKQQVNKEVDIFAKKAKMPNILRNNIGIKIKFK